MKTSKDGDCPECGYGSAKWQDGDSEVGIAKEKCGNCGEIYFRNLYYEDLEAKGGNTGN